MYVRYRTDRRGDGAVAWRLDVTRTTPHGDTMRALIAMIVGSAFLLLGACNTMEGAGKDVKAAGGKVESEAKENKRY
jgi:predicted small secreted protein